MNNPKLQTEHAQDNYQEYLNKITKQIADLKISSEKKKIKTTTISAICFLIRKRVSEKAKQQLESESQSKSLWSLSHPTYPTYLLPGKNNLPKWQLFEEKVIEQLKEKFEVIRCDKMDFVLTNSQIAKSKPNTLLSQVRCQAGKDDILAGKICTRYGVMDLLMVKEDHEQTGSVILQICEIKNYNIFEEENKVPKYIKVKKLIHAKLLYNPTYLT